MKTLVIGATGMVGQALMRRLSNAVGTYNKASMFSEFEHLDITDVDAVDKLVLKVSPKVCYVPAYISSIDACENPDTDRVNIEGIANVIDACAKRYVKMVFFSSSYVFDGKSQYPYSPNQSSDLPLNRYGQQKAVVETLLEDSGIAYTIIRTIGVFGYDFGGKNFAMSVLTHVQQNAFMDTPQKIFVPNDQFMNPIHADDLADVTIKLAEGHSSGIYHVAGDTCRNKYDFATDILNGGNITWGSQLLEGVSSENMMQAAKRPKMGCLDCTRLPMLGIKIPSYQDGLAKFWEDNK